MTSRSEYRFRLIITAAVIAVGGFAYWLVGSNSSDDERRQAETALAIAEANAVVIDQNCESLSVLYLQVHDLLQITGAERIPPPDSTPAQLEGYRVANIERAKIRELGDQLFTPPLCADGLPPAGTTTTTR